MLYLCSSNILKMKSGIYKVISPTNKIYIGQSKDVEYRLNRYKELNCKAQILLYRSFLKHGVENHSFEIVEKGNFTREELNVLEKKYVKEFDSFRGNNINGLNLTTGGDCVEFDSSTIDKMSKTRIKLYNEGQTNSKIPIEDIYDIKKMIAFNISLKEIAGKYKVGITTISEIKAHRSWKNIPDYIVKEEEKHLTRRTNKISPKQKLTEAQRNEIIELIKQGKMYKEIAPLYGISKSGVQQINRSFKKHNR